MEALLTVAASVAAGLTVAEGIRRLFLGLRRFYRWVEAAAKLIDHELRPNSGASVKDTVNTIRDDVECIRSTVTTLDGRVKKLEGAA